MTTSDPSELKRILIRLLADVDDSMEFQGTMFNTDPSHKVSKSLAKAISALERYAAQREAEAQVQILRGFRRRDFVDENFYKVAVLDRLAQLHKGTKEEK